MSNRQNNQVSNIAYGIFVAVCLLLPIVIMVYKLNILGYSISGLIPVVSYRVQVNQQVDGHGDAMTISTYLPKSDERQTIIQEQNYSEAFNFAVQNDPLNRIASWSVDSIDGRQTIRYEYNVQAKHFKYNLPDSLQIPAQYPASLQRYLIAEEGVQVDDPMIAETVRKLFPIPETRIKNSLFKIHRYLQDKFVNKNFSGFTDALTALKLGEASCNGKGRLFVALARKINIPARLVGGLILKSGSKKTSHQWVEAYVNGRWVPFDTINDHLAELPANFVTLYYGDQVLFKRSANINFQYYFQIAKTLMPQVDTQAELRNANYNITNIYSLFERVGISQNLLKILLMIPLGALVVVIARNVIGLETFGTFLPALIASAARETGIVWGAIGFLIILLTVSGLRRLLDWFRLLHSPKMAIMLTAVVIVMLFITIISVNIGLFDLAHLTLFPIAILAITAERFAIIEIEQGWRKAMRITTTTLFVITAAYLFMDSLFLQSMILAFPELLFVIIALYLWLGKWTGMRVSEFFRFRKIIMGTSTS